MINDFSLFKRKESMISENQSSQFETQDQFDFNCSKLQLSNYGQYSNNLSLSNSITNSPCIVPIKRRGRPKKIKSIEELSLENQQKKKDSMDESYIQYYMENEKKKPEQMQLLIKKRILVCQNLKKRKWNEEEIKKLYKGIEMHGSDYHLLTVFISTKSYKQVQEKFNKELKKKNIQIEESLRKFQENKKNEKNNEIQNIQQEIKHKQEIMENKLKEYNAQQNNDNIINKEKEEDNKQQFLIKNKQDNKSKFSKKRLIITEQQSNQSSPIKQQYY